MSSAPGNPTACKPLRDFCELHPEKCFGPMPAQEGMPSGEQAGPPPSLSRCLDACAAGGEVLRSFCRSIRDPRLKAGCWGLEFVTENNRRLSMPSTLGIVIAERTLTTAGSKARVRVLLGRPKKDRFGGDYTCPFVIEGLGESTVRQASGIDSMQALQFAMQAIRKALIPHAKQLRWVGSEPGGLGFPMAIPEIFGVEFSQRLEDMVQRATDHFGQSLERSSRRNTKHPPPASLKTKTRSGRSRPAKKR
jgi:hypothetical protein